MTSKQTDIAKKQYQGLDKVHEFDRTKSKDDKKTTNKNYYKSYLIYNTNHSVYK